MGAAGRRLYFRLLRCREINLCWLLQSLERRTFLLRTTTYPGLHLAHLGHLGTRAPWMMFIPGSRESEAHADAAVREYFLFLTRLSLVGTLTLTSGFVWS